MTTQESKQQYEGAILQQLIKNSERLVIVENDISQIKDRLTAIEDKFTNIEDKFTNIEDKFTNIEDKFTNIEGKLNSLEKTNQKIESLLGWLKWIAGGIGAIILSLIANFVYSFVS